MNTKGRYIILLILSFFGLIPFTFDNKLNKFRRNIFLQIYSICLDVYVSTATLLSFYRLGFFNNIIMDHLKIYNWIVTLNVTAGFIEIIYQKIYHCDILLEIFNISQTLYFNSRILDVTNHKKVCLGVCYLIILTFAIVPVLIVLFNFIGNMELVKETNNLFAIVTITFGYLWILFAMLPYFLVIWIVQNILKNMNSRICKIQLNNSEYKIRDNATYTNLTDEINLQSIHYSAIAQLMNTINSNFSRIILINVFICFISFTYQLFMWLQFLFHYDHFRFFIFSNACNIIYFWNLIILTVMLSDAIFRKCQDITYNLNNLPETYLNCSSKQSVSNKQ